MPDLNRPLRVFLCHSSGDKPVIRELYRRLSTKDWIDPWLDEEKLYPGHDWDLEIERAVESSDAVIVCLSNGSLTKEGYIQRELRFVLDIALTKPEETIFIIPLRLEECQPPRRLRAYQYVDYFPEKQREYAYNRVIVSLEKRAESLGLQRTNKSVAVPDNDNLVPFIQNNGVNSHKYTEISKEVGGLEFVRVPAGKFVMGSKGNNKLAYDNEMPQHTVDIAYDYWMARFPLTNRQYAEYISKEKHPVIDWMKKEHHPVVNISWDDAMAYCKWFNETFISDLGDAVLRLPTEAEWEKAARGTESNEWPWGDEFDLALDKNKCNSQEGGKGATTPVDAYSMTGGDSPYGCSDMVGNVWEWTHSLFKEYPYDIKDGREYEKNRNTRVLRGGSFLDSRRGTRCAYRYNLNPDQHFNRTGFRVVVSPISFD